MNAMSHCWLTIVFVMTFCTFLFWAVGYFANGLYGTQFDLSSCWAGLGAIATAAAAGWGKWWTDCKYNGDTRKISEKERL